MGFFHFSGYPAPLKLRRWLERWHPEQAGPGRRTRPDRAEALTRAAQYDRWVRAKVQSSRDDPRPAVADDEWQRIRAAKLAERKAVQQA